MKTIQIIIAALLVSALAIVPAYAQLPNNEGGFGRIGELTTSITSVTNDTCGGIGTCVITVLGTVGDIWNSLLDVVCQDNFLQLIGCIYPSFEQCMIGGLTGLVFGGIMGLLMTIPSLICCFGFCGIIPITGCIGVGFLGDAIGCVAGALAPLQDVHMKSPGTYRF